MQEQEKDSLQEKTRRWRLILGRDSEKKLQEIGQGSTSVLSKDELTMDQALEAIYDGKSSAKAGSGRGAGLGQSYPNLAKWLTDIRSYFPNDIVTIIQSDAIERKGLTQLLLEPETLKNVTPDISMVNTLLALKQHIPKKSKEQARQLVQSLVDEIIKSMESEMRRAVVGALNRRNHSPIPSLPNTDWKRTIQKNLKNYDKQNKRIIPEKFYFYENRKTSNEWNIILDLDQSGSMGESIIYSSIMGSIFASIPALETRVVAFDTKVTDLTETCGNDPVDMLFGVQMGGGTDINKSLKYCRNFIHTPKKTLFILISDLYEGGVEAGLLSQLDLMKESGVTVLVLLAISDNGQPIYDERLAKKIANKGIACFGCTPNKLPSLIATALKGQDLNKFAEENKI